MSVSSRVRLRSACFQVHKWIGLSLAILVIPIALTGSALVWHDWLDEALNPERAASAAPTLTVSQYQAAAERALAPGERLASLRLPRAGAIVATAQAEPAPGARPVRTTLYLDPEDGHVLDKASSNAGVVRVMHNLHGSLMVPGAGRQIVGWVGVAMLLSSLTGLWLWWPLNGRVRRGLRWQRRPETSANLHHLAGFWVAIPLAMLSFTGAWISFPAFFAALSGDPPGPARRTPPAPVAETRLSVEAAIAAAGDGKLQTVTWPTTNEPKWKIAFAGREVTVGDADGVATPVKPQPETVARLMRRLHDGTGMGALWQAIIFVGGLIPALLAVTGTIMWLRERRRRGASRATAPGEEVAGTA